MFATTFYLEREPLSFGELPIALQTWVQNAGGVAALGLLFWYLNRVLGPRPSSSFAKNEKSLEAICVGFCAGVSALLYAALGVLFIAAKVGLPALQKWIPAGGQGT